MHLLLFIGYSVLCCYGILKIPFFRKSGIRPVWLLLLFAGHVLTGCIHNIIAYRYFPEHGDVWNYFQLSFLFRHRLSSEFHIFLANNSAWTYFSHYGIIYVQMLLDLFSFDNIYINTLLFAFPTFMGNIALFRVFRHRFPDDLLTATTAFGLPSVLFWTSCIYREGVLYMLLGFLFYHLDQLFSQSPQQRSLKLHPRRTLFYSFSILVLIAYFRSAVAILLLPPILIWWLSEHRRQPADQSLSRREHTPPRRWPWILTGGGATVLLILILASPGLFSPLLRSLAAEQASFQVLEGHSRLALPILEGSFASLWHLLPTAVLNGYFEPLPGSGGQPLYLIFSLELLLIWGVLTLSLIRLFTPTPPALSPGFSRCCIFFALTGMLLIGMMVPFAGSIVRYRSIYLPFLLAPCLYSLRGFQPFKTLNQWLVNRLKILI